MEIKSPAFKNMDNIPALYSCDGKDINPPLAISDVPENTVSLILIMEDPDAPAGVFDHWLVWNINKDTEMIAEGDELPDYPKGNNSFGFKAYGGPCPPRGQEHRYFFRLFALDAVFGIDPEEATRPALNEFIDEHKIEEAVLIGLYKRD
jgi:Raf kinase inhibitor-like YbhB/YbcL family protein